MLQITKGEIWSVLNVLREVKEGSDPDDLEQDIDDTIEFLEAILEKEE